MMKPKGHQRHDWDVVGGTPGGFVIWRRYGDRKIVTAAKDESPRDALARQLREARKRGKP